ncbi:MAG: hypothetical protein GX092_03255 [Clostridia bacterium]|jgi:hypothetical protein|nr:hypothetical protein [Clostridia bacterium]
MLSLFWKSLFKKKPYKKGYFVHQAGAKNLLCKILNEYETIEEAKEDLLALIMNETTEKKLEKDFLTKKSW